MFGQRLGVGERGGDASVAQERDESRVAKALMARLNHVIQFQPVKLVRQMVEELGEVVAIELLERRELPQHRPELVAQLGEAGTQKARDEAAGLGQHLLLGDEARALHREHEAVRRRRGPFAEARLALQPVMGGVDLDRGEMRRRIGQLVGLLQTLRIKGAAPRRIDPAADADADASRCFACVPSARECLRTGTQANLRVMPPRLQHALLDRRRSGLEQGLPAESGREQRAELDQNWLVGIESVFVDRRQ